MAINAIEQKSHLPETPPDTYTAMVTAIANPTDTVMGPPWAPRLRTACPTHPHPSACILKEKCKNMSVSVKCYWPVCNSCCCPGIAENVINY